MRVAFVLRSTEVTPALFVLFSAQRRVHKSEVANSFGIGNRALYWFCYETARDKLLSWHEGMPLRMGPLQEAMPLKAMPL